MFCRFEGAMRFHCNQTARRPVTKRPLSEPSMAVKRIASSANFYRRGRLILSPPKTRLKVHYRQSHENHKKHEYLAITTKKGRAHKTRPTNHIGITKIYRRPRKRFVVSPVETFLTTYTPIGSEQKPASEQAATCLPSIVNTLYIASP